MRLKSFLIERYGCFERALIPFDAAKGRVNLIVAPNGAGKSVLRTAFHDLLFGIPARSPMRFRFGYPDMHLHADAVSEDGVDFAFAWRRRGDRSFPSANESAEGGTGEAQRRLAAAMGRITPRQVEQLFALDTQRLREGGDELAQGGDGLGVALLSGSGELASARAVRIGLDQRRAALWKTARIGSLPAALRDLEAARKRLRDAVQPPRQYEAQTAAIAAQLAMRQRADEDFSAARAGERRLARIARVRPHLQDLDRARTWLEENQDAPVLPGSLAEALRKATGAAVLAQAILQARQEAVERAGANAAGIVRDAAALALDDRLALLAPAAGKARAAAGDVIQVRSEWETASGEVARALRDLGSALPPAQAETLLPNLEDMARARALVTEHSFITAKQEAAAKRLAEVAQQLEPLIEAAGTQADEDATLRLEALLAEIGGEGDPQRAAGGADRVLHAAQARQDSCLARIPFWSGGIAALLDIAMPDETRLQALDDAHAAVLRALDQATAAHALREAVLGAVRRDLAALHAQSVPDRAMLTASRARRDALWGRVFREAFGGETPEADTPEPLPLLFERSLRAADDVADRITAALAQVEEAARLSALVRDEEAACETLARGVADAKAAAGVAALAWRHACIALRLPEDASMRELRGFVAARQDAVEAAEQVSLAKAASAALEARHAAWAARLAALLARPAAPLPALLAEARLVLERQKVTAREAIGRKESRRVALQEQGRAQKTADEAAASLAAWRLEWDPALRALGRPAGEMPQVTAPMLQHLDRLRLYHDKAADLAARVAGMDRILAAFTEESQNLAGALGETGGEADGEAFALARRLVARRELALRHQSQEAEARRALAEAGDALAVAEAAALAARQHVDALVAECGAQDLQEAQARLIAADERNRSEVLRDGALAALRKDGDGLAEDVLREEARDVGPEAMEAAREAAEAALAEAKERGEAAALATAALDQRLEDARHSTDATLAAAGQEEASALVARLLDEEIVLRVASAMLSSAMAAVEQGAGDAAVGRISHAFERITGGACMVRAGEDEAGGTVLTVVERGETQQPKAIAGLSEGTRDQLYLALRMVAIEDHVAAGPRLPFIADDVLQTFDDARALATFRALVAMSETVQVIVLTHHEHLVELAAGLPVHVHRLAA